MDLEHDEEGGIVTKYSAWEYSTLSDAQKNRAYWVGLIGPASPALFFLVCVVLTMNINYPDYPLLDKFFGGDDDLFLAIAWPIIAFNLPPLYHEGGRRSGRIGLMIGGFFMLVVVLFNDRGFMNGVVYVPHVFVHKITDEACRRCLLVSRV